MMGLMSHGTQDMYPTFLQRERGYSPSNTATLTMITNVGAILGGLAFGYYSDHRGRRRAMITSALFGIVADNGGKPAHLRDTVIMPFGYIAALALFLAAYYVGHAELFGTHVL